MSDRTTSGAYRIPLVSPKPSSDTTSKLHAAPHSFTSAKKSAADYKNCNIVAQERIWKEHVLKEKNAAKLWYHFVVNVQLFSKTFHRDQNWRFLAEFDSKVWPTQYIILQVFVNIKPFHIHNKFLYSMVM